MAKVLNLSDTQQQIAFIEHDFYQLYVETFKTSELGRIKSLLPLREMALNGNIHYQIFGGISSQLGEHRLRKKCNNILIDGISFIEKLSFNAFNEGTRLKHCVSLAEKLIGVAVKKISGDQGYSGNDNRTFCRDNKIETSFTQKGRTGKNEIKNATKRELARVRTTAMEGSFGTQKEHYGLRKVAARIKSTEIMLIFFGVHTANVVHLARRESVQLALAA